MSSVKETTQTKIAPREQLLRDLWDDGNVSVDGHIATDLEHWVPRFMKHGIEFTSNFTDEEYEEGLCGNEDFYMVFDPAIYKESAYCKVENETDNNNAQEYDAKKTPGELYQLVQTSHGLVPNNPLPRQYWRLKRDHEIVVFIEKVVPSKKTFKVFIQQVSGDKYNIPNKLGENALMHLHFLDLFEHVKNWIKTRKFKRGWHQRLRKGSLRRNPNLNGRDIYYSKGA